MEGAQPVDDARVGHLVVLVHLGPGADPHAVRLLDPAVLDERLGRRLPVGPDPFLERTPELGVVRLAHEVVALVVEGGIEEEPVVVQLEMPAFLPDPALAKREQLLTLGERTDCYGPFFKRDWHGTCMGTRSSGAHRHCGGGCPAGSLQSKAGPHQARNDVENRSYRSDILRACCTISNLDRLISQVCMCPGGEAPPDGNVLFLTICQPGGRPQPPPPGVSSRSASPATRRP